ncbi:MAG TPA: slipin family protein [candidate division Zixibacteria bacterium]|nr:slipin family protein [candidate division Zixibacteria bacterium]MDD4918086.1 slipin family protein [candidate division Zixibacteria bacterium]MDM7972045.1 slipin family protein [candidate division Zixibacteria bacterium]HOD66824.1 slipin family protein [candidate division Zixibacteria bacterium]HOZ07858.1 slipin family protein [candidate division Zixibacteria bacterium]
MTTFPILAVVIFFALILLFNMIKVLKEYERGVIFRLGRLIGAKGPGLIILIPIVDKMVRVDLRVITYDIPSQDVITNDNVSVKVNAVVYFAVVDPNKAIVSVANFFEATSQIAQTTLRSVLGQFELDELLANRDKINAQLQHIIDEQTEPWGVKVSVVEVKNVDLPPEMTRAIARQAEAERERRSKVIHAEGEFQAAQKLADAATVIGAAPGAMQLRFLSTLVEVSAERNSTLIFPVPIDLLTSFKSFLDWNSGPKQTGAASIEAFRKAMENLGGPSGPKPDAGRDKG